MYSKTVIDKKLMNNPVSVMWHIHDFITRMLVGQLNGWKMNENDKKKKKEWNTVKKTLKSFTSVSLCSWSLKIPN